MQFVYDGEGNLVKKINSDNTKTIYVTGIYEVNKNAGSTVTGTKTYYPAGGAMRVDGTRYYILKDHLGSASVVTNQSGTIVGEDRCYPYGETRFTTGNMQTDKLFTGQRAMASLGIYHYNARFYSPKLGRFLSADTIVPSMSNPQSFNRYSYVYNSPLNYNDPSGHKPCDERDGCTKVAKPQARCSVGEGYFNGSFKCTAADLNKASISKRKVWLNEMLASVDAGLPKQFTNINGILDAFEHTNTGTPGSWASWGDAGILTSIQNGLASTIEEKYIPGFKPADQAWEAYTMSFFTNPNSNTTRKLWGAAEGLGTNYGRLLAGDNGQSKTSGEVIFLAIGNAYRDRVARYNPDAIETDVLRDFASWILDPASTIPYTDIPPVQLVAEITLRIK
jgi:RHS repeat-associated protein